MLGDFNFIPSAVTDRRKREIEIDQPSSSTSSEINETSAFTNGLDVNISTVEMLISFNTTQNRSVETFSQ